MGSCCSAVVCPGCHGDMDKSAVAKVFMVFIYTFLMAGYFFSYGMGCEKMLNGPAAREARYDFWRRSEARQELQVCFDKSAVNVMAYFATYVVLCGLSVIGATCMFLTIKGYNKVYAICLFAAWVCLSILDFWTLGSMLNYFESVITNANEISTGAISSFTESYTGNLRSEYGFRIMGIWFAETYIFLNTAWDAFDRSDERPKQPIAMTGGNYRHM